MPSTPAATTTKTVLLTDRPSLVRYAMSVLRTATDWQEAQTAIANNPRWRAFAEEQGGDESGALAFVQGVIADAEEMLGDDLTY